MFLRNLNLNSAKKKMSDNIPIEIQVEIIKRVPVKSLIRFRSVSKQWMSLIDSPEFITYHRVNQTQPHHLLVMHCEEEDMKFKYVSIVEDDGDDHRFSPTVTTPTVKLVRHPTLLGCSHGLVCLFNYWKRLVVLWNPSIRKSFGIALPDGVDALGFGVCPQTSDPKIVKITHTIRYEAQVFTRGANEPITRGANEPSRARARPGSSSINL
ncbi:putative F-box domain-containing protein [Helianthus annuus]|nr:putative F-box domain-containing protein [Helianthus annuus]